MKKSVLLTDEMENIEQKLKFIDTDNTGNIEYTEFISASIVKNVHLNEKIKRNF